MKIDIDNLNQQLTGLLLGNSTFQNLGRFGKLHAFSAISALSKTICRFWEQEAAHMTMLTEGLKKDIQGANAQMMELQKQANALKGLEEELKAVQTENEKEASRKATLEQQILSGTQLYDATVQKIAQQEKDLVQLKTDYESLVAKSEAIQKNFEPFEKAHQANTKMFEAHFTENKVIWEALQSNDGSVQELVQTIEYQLNAFDAALKTVVDVKDKLEISKVPL